jgi:hypothetical protein
MKQDLLAMQAKSFVYTNVHSGFRRIFLERPIPGLWNKIQIPPVTIDRKG